MTKKKSSKATRRGLAQKSDSVHTTKIVAKSSASEKAVKPDQATEPSAKPADAAIPGQKLSKSERKVRKKKSQQKSDRSTEKPLREVFLLARPFVAIGRYLRDSWRELRLVRWPSRGNTWKMTLAVLIYCAIFIVFIVLIDSLFTFIFNLLLSQ